MRKTKQQYLSPIKRLNSYIMESFKMVSKNSPTRLTNTLQPIKKEPIEGNPQNKDHPLSTHLAAVNTDSQILQIREKYKHKSIIGNIPEPTYEEVEGLSQEIQHELEQMEVIGNYVHISTEDLHIRFPDIEKIRQQLPQVLSESSTNAHKIDVLSELARVVAKMRKDLMITNPDTSRINKENSNLQKSINESDDSNLKELEDIVDDLDEKREKLGLRLSDLHTIVNTAPPQTGDAEKDRILDLLRGIVAQQNKIFNTFFTEIEKKYDLDPSVIDAPEKLPLQQRKAYLEELITFFEHHRKDLENAFMLFPIKFDLTHSYEEFRKFVNNNSSE